MFYYLLDMYYAILGLGYVDWLVASSKIRFGGSLYLSLLIMVDSSICELLQLFYFLVAGGGGIKTRQVGMGN